MNLTNNIPLREQNIVLIGFMGVGKTTIGQLIANKLYRDFIDIDHEIEGRHGMSVKDIFSQKGEAWFREEERNVIRELCTKTRLKVISLGGGAFMQEEVREICLSTSLVFFLDLSWDSWKQRLHLISSTRPVLENRSLQDIEELFYKRQNLYAFNHSTISTDQMNAEDAAEYIINTLKVSWDIYEPRAPLVFERE